ncbi:MAG: hypothetical protein R3B97_17715 [Dehalococcoidia bacterium]
MSAPWASGLQAMSVMSSSTAGIEDAVGLGCAVHEAVVDLVGDERDAALRKGPLGGAELALAVVGDTDVFDFARAHGVSEAAHDRFVAKDGERVVDLVQANLFDAKALEAVIE